MMTFLRELRAATMHIVTGLADREMWGDLQVGLFGIGVLCLRLLILALFPVTLPLIAWLMMKAAELRPKQEAAAREAWRRNIHRNGNDIDGSEP